MSERAPSRRSALVAGALAIIALVAWRATFGVSFSDDGHYASATYYIAQGATPLVDDMTLQSLGFLVSAPFAYVWHALFGTTGLVLALRLFYVALAAAGGYVVFRALRPSFGDLPALLTAAVPLLAPPYGVIGASYNTVAALGCTLAVALAVAALRDGDRRCAVAAGVALAMGAISYPPLALGGLLFAACFVVLARSRTLTGAFLAGAATVVTVFGAWVFLVPGVTAVREALAYSSSMWAQMAGPGARLGSFGEKLSRAMIFRQLAPMWGLAVTAALPGLAPRTRAIVLALVPAAAAAPGIRFLLLGTEQSYFGANGATLLVLVTAALTIPVIAWTVRASHRTLAQLVVLSAAMCAVNFPIVAASTNSSFYTGVAVVGLAPLTAALVCGWAVAVRDDGGEQIGRVAGAALIVVLLAMLFARSFRDEDPLALDTRIRSGAAAGILTSAHRARSIAADESLGRRWATENDDVLVVGSPLSYLLVGGRMQTNAVWLNVGDSDRATIDYFERMGTRPDVVFVARSLVAAEGGLSARAAEDPLFGWLLEHYVPVDHGEHLVAFAPR